MHDVAELIPAMFGPGGERGAATAHAAVERRAAELGIKRILRKPLSNQVLLNALREELK